MNTEKDIRMKDGTIVPKGTPVSFEPDKPQLCIVHAAKRDYRVRPQTPSQLLDALLVATGKATI